MPNHWNQLEHHFFKGLKGLNLKDKKFLLAVSGGLDSMVLLSLFKEVVGVDQIAVAHLHHGFTRDPEQLAFRDRACELVKRKSQELVNFEKDQSAKLHFLLARSEVELSNEAEMRDFRYQHLHSWRQREGFDFIVLAHHSEDQVETQILHLLRGCGLEGLRGMQVLEGFLLRPLLKTSKAELLEYAQNRSIEYIEDPSNQKLDYLRNWIRSDWLPRLDFRQEGMKQSLFNSFQKISESLGNLQNENEKSAFGVAFDKSEQSLLRSRFDSSSFEQKKSMIYAYLRHLDVKNVTQGQVEEIIKRLDKSQTMITFSMSHSLWTANAEYIVAQVKGI